MQRNRHQSRTARRRLRPSLRSPGRSSEAAAVVYGPFLNIRFVHATSRASNNRPFVVVGGGCLTGCSRRVARGGHILRRHGPVSAAGRQLAVHGFDGFF